MLELNGHPALTVAAEYLATLGCDFGQGYYFSRPVEATLAEALLNDPPWLRATG